MQEDMHYYGTYALARAAGLHVEDAKAIAYSAQYVDDSVHDDDQENDDGGMLQTIATAHHNLQVAVNARLDHLGQRQVWVPFHFYPGNKGETMSEKLVCQKNSDLSQEMVANHIQHAVSSDYGLQLIGIAAHVYADTFSHYGFSGVSSRKNAVDPESFELDVENDEMRSYLGDKFTKFMNKYKVEFITENWRRAVSKVAEAGSGALGHGAVGTYPDRPFLKWKFKYANGGISERNNSETFMEGCEKLYQLFVEFRKKSYGNEESPSRNFEDIRNKIETIIQLEAGKEGRIEAWKEAVLSGQLFEIDGNTEEELSYSPDEWEDQKEKFSELKNSAEAVELGVYRFHQAAIYHRDFTLKHLLPKHGIVVL